MSEGDYPRVLFVSVNPFSETSNNGKTFASFFIDYPEDSLAQLYFHRELPSSNATKNYFRVSDEDLFRAFPFFWRASGSRVVPSSSDQSLLPAAAHSWLKRSRLVRLARQILWTTVSLKRSGISSWVTDFRPQVIFFCGGDAAWLYGKVRRLAAQSGARLVFYVTDDYVLPKRSANLAEQLGRAWTRHVFKRITRTADLVYTVGEDMSDAYLQRFGVVSRPLMNLVQVETDQEPSPPPDDVDETVNFVYAGSLHSGRWRVVEAVAKRIEAHNQRGLKARLDIYGPDIEPKVLTRVHRPPYSTYRGMLTPSELRKVLRHAGVLLHVESAEPHDISATALSVSTKIPEYLSQGKSVLAVGPSVASIKYLERNGAAMVVHPDDEAGLDRVVQVLIQDCDVRRELGRRAKELALANHNAGTARPRLWKSLQRLV